MSKKPQKADEDAPAEAPIPASLTAAEPGQPAPPSTEQDTDGEGIPPDTPTGPGAANPDLYYFPPSLRHLQARTDPPTGPISAETALRRLVQKIENASTSGSEEHRQLLKDAGKTIRFLMGFEDEGDLGGIDPPSPYGPIDPAQKKLSSHGHKYDPWLPAEPATSAIEEAQKIDAEKGTHLATTSNDSSDDKL